MVNTGEALCSVKILGTLKHFKGKFMGLGTAQEQMKKYSF